MYCKLVVTFSAISKWTERSHC
uniref:Uncharacterized protein n=1 Tax=Anguilla anguilla TaxID=7936 RepID=A0A0E9RNV3_ANGAN